jgi:hypothetical protein
MKFDTPATSNPIDQLKIIGHPTSRIDGPLKTTGTAIYAYEWHDAFSTPTYGYVVGARHRQGANCVDRPNPRESCLWRHQHRYRGERRKAWKGKI